MKVFTFDAFRGNKHYGDCNAPRQIVIVKNASTKKEARELAAQCIDGLRIVNAGKSFLSYAAALYDTSARVGLYNRTKTKDEPGCVWFALNAADPDAVAKHKAIAAL